MLQSLSVRTMCVRLVVGLLVLRVGLGYGADAERNYRVYGGLGSCTMYLQVMLGTTELMPAPRASSHPPAPAMTSEKQHYRKWIEGYLTAINVKTSDTYDILGKSDIDGAIAWLKNYCHENPRRSLSYAMDALVDELYPQRMTKEPADATKR